MRMSLTYSNLGGFAKISLFLMLLIGLAGMAEGQQAIKRGDVTGDGMIDGRDALVTLRSIVGLQTLTDGEQERADVYPNPGVNGRTIGDGTLTEEDVRQMLRYAVRLIPEGNLNGEFYDEPPVINDFQPRTGAVGTQVVISGENFASASPENNIVRLGGIPVPISEITGTHITVEIIEEAQSGAFEVLTPAGKTTSGGQFTVTAIAEGVLDLGAGLNPEEFTIVSTFDENQYVDSQGSFDIGVNRDGVSLLGAASEGDTNNTFLALNLPEMFIDENGKTIRTRQTNQAMQVNAMSTAKTLIFLHPFLATNNPAAVSRLMEILDTIPEVTQFASVIGNRYPQGADGLNDPAVKEAWETAMIAVFNNLPPGLLYSTHTTQGKKIRHSQNISPINHAKNSIQLIPLSNGHSARLVRAGLDYVEVEHLANRRELSVGYPESLDYSPLDWYVKMYRVDPADMPVGVLNPFVAASHGIRQIGTKQTTVIPAKQWTANIDIVGTAINYAFDTASGWLDVGSDNFTYENTTEGVYVLRMYSGSIANTDPEDFQAIATIEDGRANANMAIVLNLSLAVMDFWSLISGSEEGFMRNAIRTGMTKGMTSLIEHSSRLIPPQNDDQTLNALFTVMVEVSKGVADAAKEAGISGAKEKLNETCATVVELSSGILTALSRISSLGKIGERIAGMMGYLLNPLGWEIAPYGPTPLETAFLVVGDPFRPSITRIEPEFGAPGSEVTIYGERFLTDPQHNTVRFGDHPARIVRVENSTQMVVKVPRYLNLFQYYELSIETGASSSIATAPTEFYIDPVPFIQDITPFVGYSPTTNENNPFYGEEGMTVQLRGSYLDLPYGDDTKQVLIGNREAEITYALPDYLTVRIPAGLSGTVPILLRDTERGHESNTVYFDIYDPPRIRSLSSTEVQAGESFTIRGSNLVNARVKIGDEWATVTSTTRNQVIVQMPTVGEENESFRVEVWTPSGSASTQVTRAEGLTVPRPVALPQGAEIPVNDPTNSNIGANGKITLAEAVDIANGTINPFRNGYDDNNINTYTYFRNVRDEETGETRLVNVGTRPEFIPGGFGSETHNYYDVTLDDDENEISRSLTRSESLDATDDDKEEGDFIRYWGRSLPDPDEFNLAPYRDRIRIESGERVVSGDLDMGPQDEIEMRSISRWEVNGGLTISNNNKISFEGTIQANNPIVLSGNSVIDGDATLENASLILENEIGIEMRSLTILNARSHGVEIRNGGLNELSYFTMDQCGQNGILITNSPENKFRYTTINQCENHGIEIQASHLTQIHLDSGNNPTRPGIANCQNGVLITNSRNCTISSDRYQSEPSITECRGHGILIQNGGFHTLEYLRIQNNGQCGILCSDSEANVIFYSVLFGNQDDAIRLNGGSGSNYLIDLNIFENQGNGVLIQGTENHGNELRYLHIGYNWRTGQFAGNGKNGIKLTGGASDNFIRNSEMYLCQENGILITGANTINNQILDSDIAYQTHDENADYGNQMDGIRIEQSAGNTIIMTNVGQNVGHGINLQDSSDNFIENCKIGDPRSFYSDSDYYRPNQKRGMRIAGNVIGNIISACTFSQNLEGGLLLDGINHPDASDNVPSVLARLCTVGHYKGASNIRSRDESRTAGPAIECNNVSFIIFENITTFKHDTGVLIGGDQNNALTFEQLQIRSSIGKGLHVQNAQDLFFDGLYITGCEEDGIYLKNVEDAEFTNPPPPPNVTPYHIASANKGNGAYFESCKNFTVQYGSFSNNDKNGVLLVDSEDFFVWDSWFWENVMNGISVQNTSELSFGRIRPQRNTGMGIKLVNATNLELLGTPPPRMGFFITQNKGGGLWIENSQNIQIGKIDREGSISTSNPSPNIVITGDQTRNVTIECCNLMDAYDSECIRIDGGKGIRIGSSQPGSVNNIERNGPVGILVQGANTEAAILNNIIGEHEMYESGERILGNDIGIVLEQGANHILIQGNIINANRSHGILIHEGANSNAILRNQITENGANGVQVEGTGTRFNQISQNSISRNLQKGIRLVSNGNDEIAAPVITRVEPQQNLIQGKVVGDAPDGSQIEVYADPDDEGLSLIGITQLFAKKFSLTTDIPIGKNLHALVIHPGGNASEFGETYFESKRDNFIFTEYKENQSDIFLYNYVSERITPLTNSPGNDHSPSLSSDGNQMLFVSDRGGNPDIWYLPFDTFAPISAVNDPTPDYDPDWTPDGSKLVYVSERDGNPEIYLQGLAAIGGGEITNNKGDQDTFSSVILRSAMAGDGFGVHFTSTASSLSQIQVFMYADPAAFKWEILAMENGVPGGIPIAEGTAEPVETGWHVIELENVTVPQEFLFAMYYLENDKPQLGMTMDGELNRWWLFSRTRGWVNVAFRPIMVKALTGGGEEVPQRLTEHDAVDRSPAVSPDGTKIAFQSIRAGKQDIWLMDIDGTNLRNLTTATGNSSLPAWSPDGQRLAFVSDRDGNPEIYVLDIESGNTLRVSNHESVDTEPVWNAKGSHILFASNRESDYEIYTLNINNPSPQRVTRGIGNLREPETGSLNTTMIETNASTKPAGKVQKGETVQISKTVSPFAAGTLNLDITDGEAEPGDSVKLTIQLENAQTLGNLAFELFYESNVLRLLEAPVVQLQTDHSMFEVNPVIYPAAINPLRLNWIGAEGLSSGNSQIQLAFEVLSGVQKAETEIDFRIANAYDTELNPFDIAAGKGVLTITGNQTEVEGWMIY